LISEDKKQYIFVALELNFCYLVLSENTNDAGWKMIWKDAVYFRGFGVEFLPPGLVGEYDARRKPIWKDGWMDWEWKEERKLRSAELC
jgi:hypothetical protein